MPTLSVNLLEKSKFNIDDEKQWRRKTTRCKVSLVIVSLSLTHSPNTPSFLGTLQCPFSRWNAHKSWYLSSQLFWPALSNVHVNPTSLSLSMFAWVRVVIRPRRLFLGASAGAGADASSLLMLPSSVTAAVCWSSCCCSSCCWSNFFFFTRILHTHWANCLFVF